MRTKELAMWIRRILAPLALGALAACGGASSIEHPWDREHRTNADLDWRDQVIYQILVDRFENGDPANDYNVEPTIPGRYQGGDWQGIIDRLDYLEELGVTALWISPVVQNTEEDGGFASYHGYWMQDPLRPNPHFGDLLKLRELVDKAHARDMLVILDVVTNHMGQMFYYDINGNGRPDEWISGGGTPHTCVQICNNPGRANECSEDERTYCRDASEQLHRIQEWDPDYDPRGVQGFTSLGFSGPSDIRFTDWPHVNRTPPMRPPEWFGWPDDKPWFDSPSWYHRKGRPYVWWHEGRYSHDFVREQETQGDFPGGLKALNTDHPDVQEALIRAFQYWIEVADFDGFRIDTVKHIDRPEVYPNRRGFWGPFTDRMRAHAARLGKRNFFMFGEAFDGNDTLIGSYTFGGIDEDGPFGRLDSVFYFSLKHQVIDPVFMDGAPTTLIECLYNARMGIPQSEHCLERGFPEGPTHGTEPHASSAEGGVGLPPQKLPVTFVDNHDLARYLFDDPRVESLYNALFYLMTFDGIPAIYYGTEQLFDGGVDPKNREAMWRGNPGRGFEAFDTEHQGFRTVRDLIAMRREHVALRRGDVEMRWTTDRPRGEIDSGIVAFERIHPEQTALVVINTADDQESVTCAPVDEEGEGGECMAVSFSPGTRLVDVSPGSDGASYTVASDGTVSVDVPPRSGRVLIRE
jgi:alpha-amylase